MKSNETVNVIQLKDLCRTCLKKVDVSVNIFRYMIEDNLLISQVIQTYLPLQVHPNDNLPQHMCSQCLVSLSLVYRFIKTCLETENLLQTCLQYPAVTIKVEDQEDVAQEELIIIKDDADVIKDEEEILKRPTKLKKPKTSLKRRYYFGRNFTCHICPKLFLKKQHLVRHLKVHAKQKYYKCDHCDSHFKFISGLRRHEAVHDQKQNFTCDTCGKTFIEHIHFLAHMQSHVKIEFMCDQCGNYFKVQHALERHIRAVHGSPSDQNVSKTRTCKHCRKVFSTTAELTSHYTSEHIEEGFLCDDCGKYLKTKMALKLHLRTHTGEKPHICSDCGRGFAQASSLVYHRRVHTGEKPYSCQVCSRRFTQPAHMKTHMKTHTGEKPYECPYCSKRFALKKNMIVHSRIHTGEKPYPCSVCDKKFIDASSRKKHFKGHQQRFFHSSSDFVDLEITV